MYDYLINKTNIKSEDEALNEEWDVFVSKMFSKKYNDPVIDPSLLVEGTEVPEELRREYIDEQAFEESVNKGIIIKE